MKKKLFTSFFLAVLSIGAWADSAVTESFDNESVFPSFELGGITSTQHTGSFGQWTVYDGNGMKVYGSEGTEFPNEYEPMAWMPFNFTKTTPPYESGMSHSGEQCMISFCPVEKSVPATTDHWLISPELSGDAQDISFYVRELLTKYGSETYEVLASSTDNKAPGSFSIVGSVHEAKSKEWEKVTVTLPAGTKYFAIRHISYDIFALMIDDVTYLPKGATGSSFYYYENEDGTLTITHSKERWHGPEGDPHLGTCHSYSGDIVIPEEIDGKRVTAIGKDAFYRCDITSVKLPNTLKLIDDGAFLECPNVKELTIPASVDSIGRAAFNAWDALEQVTIEDSPNVLHAGRGGVSVMSSMFSDQPLLKKAYVGRNHICPTVGASMDYEINLFARSHVEEITFGDYVTEIQKHELLGCKSLKKVNLSKNITSIGDIAFDGCELLSEIEIPDGVEEIGKRAFNDCFVMPTQKLPSKLRTISQEAFRRCFALTSVTIPASVLSIGANAFVECYGVTSLKLEDSPNAIQLPCRVFDDFRNLKTLYIGRNYIAEYDWYGNFISNHPTLEEATVAGDITEVQNQMLNGCAVLKKVTLGDKITRIGIDAFAGCSILEDINLPVPLEEIGKSAFWRCYALKHVKLPSSLKTIGETAFNDCSSITSIAIPPSVVNIGSLAFNGTKMSSISCFGTTPPICVDWIFGGLSAANMILFYPKESRDAYKSAVCWKEFFDDNVEEFDETGIDTTTIDKEMNSGNFHDLQGRKVNSQAVGKGLYIINGKKIIVR